VLPRSWKEAGRELSEPAAGPLALLCRVRGRLFSIPLAHVVETLRPLPLATFAGMPPFVLGVSLIRGVPTPVVDPGRLFEDGAETDPRRFVTVRAGSRTVALAVDEVSGIRDLGAMSGAELPPLLSEAAAGVVSKLAAMDAELLVVLGSTRWIPESGWQAIEAGGTGG